MRCATGVGPPLRTTVSLTPARHSVFDRGRKDDSMNGRRAPARIAGPGRDRDEVPILMTAAKGSEKSAVETASRRRARPMGRPAAKRRGPAPIIIIVVVIAVIVTCWVFGRGCGTSNQARQNDKLKTYTTDANQPWGNRRLSRSGSTPLRTASSSRPRPQSTRSSDRWRRTASPCPRPQRR